MLSTSAWVSTGRLVMAFTALGCDVELIALKKHPALSTGQIKRWYRYRPLHPLESVRAAVESSQPDTMIPVDELAVLHLEELASQCHEPTTANEVFLQLLQRSLGGASVLSASRSRIMLLQMAQTLGVSIPETVPVSSEAAIEMAAAQLGLPMVLKADATAGGRGVRVVSSLVEGMATWIKLTEPPTFVRAAWRAAVWRERTHFRVWARKEKREVTAQRFVAGGERTALAVAHQGRLLAGICLEVVKTWNLRGPSSVVRIIRDETMESAMQRILEHLGASGFYGFDFMMSPEGTPLLIEMNPRPAQLSHLALGEGRDLVAAYVRGLLGKEVQDREAVTPLELIALFPQELQRDPQSPFLREAYHDVPWEAPALIRKAAGEVPAIVTEDPRWKESDKWQVISDK